LSTFDVVSDALKVGDQTVKVARILLGGAAEDGFVAGLDDFTELDVNDTPTSGFLKCVGHALVNAADVFSAASLVSETVINQDFLKKMTDLRTESHLQYLEARGLILARLVDLARRLAELPY